MTTDDRRAALRSVLIDLLVPAAGEDRIVLPDELFSGGVPRRYAAAISRNSRSVMTEVDAVLLAEEWASRIDEELGQHDDATPAELAASLPRY